MTNAYESYTVQPDDPRGKRGPPGAAFPASRPERILGQDGASRVLHSEAPRDVPRPSVTPRHLCRAGGRRRGRRAGPARPGEDPDGPEAPDRAGDQGPAGPGRLPVRAP